MASSERKDGGDDNDGSGGSSSTTGPLAYPLGKIGRLLVGQLRQLPAEFARSSSSTTNRQSKAEQVAAKERRRVAETQANARGEVVRQYFATYLEHHIASHVWVVTPSCSLFVLPSTLATVILPELNALLVDHHTTTLTMTTLPTKLTPLRLSDGHIYRFISQEHFNTLSTYVRECQRLEHVREGLAQRRLALTHIHQHGTKLMATDLEANEHNPAIILELGCSFIVPRQPSPSTASPATPSVASASSSASASTTIASSDSKTTAASTSTPSDDTKTTPSVLKRDDWTVKSHHYIIAEQAHHVNKRYVAGCPEKFNFGTSVKVPLADVTRHGVDHLSTVTCLVGHSLHHDVRYLKTLNVYDDTKGPTKLMIDTQVINHSLASPCPSAGLEKQLAHHNITPVTNLHNAGNDSHYTAMLLLAQLAAPATSEPPSVASLPGPPVAPLPADEELAIINKEIAAMASSSGSGATAASSTSPATK